MRLPQPLKNLLVTVGILFVGLSMYGTGLPMAPRGEEYTAFIATRHVSHEDLSAHVHVFSTWRSEFTWQEAVQSVARPLRGLIDSLVDKKPVSHLPHADTDIESDEEPTRPFPRTDHMSTDGSR